MEGTKELLLAPVHSDGEFPIMSPACVLGFAVLLQKDRPPMGQIGAKRKILSDTVGL
jgi:hypothetical protein